MNAKKHSTQSDSGTGFTVEETEGGFENVTRGAAVPKETEVPVEDVKETDIMKYEPILASIIIDSYQGETDDFGFFHGQGNAFFQGGMSYCGRFDHGKMHGQGVLKWSNGMIYVGDIMNNTVSGTGAYSWPDGSSYEGDVWNGLRHGFGTFKCGNDKSYTGQWKNGKRHGKGILYYDSTGDSYYDGDWVQNEKCGYGIRRFANGNMYEGHWKYNQRHGEGRMYWYNIGQEYFGNWTNGVQNGCGENIWYLKRIESSQYPLRNHYVGHFVDGERHGTGTFYYASGAQYEGDWKHNMKHGHGKFTFKNGCVFSGEFYEDRMVKYPDLILSGMTTPDISKSGIPVKSPLSGRSDSVIGSDANPLSLDVDIDDLLLDCKYDLEQRDEEMHNITHIILRYTTSIKQFYKIYSSLGVGISVDNTFVMSKLQFLAFLRDYHICGSNHTLHCINLTVDKQEESVEDCFKKIFIRDFLTNLIQVSYLVSSNCTPPDGEQLLLSSCFAELIGKLNDQGIATVKEITFQSVEKYQEVMQYISKCFDVYQYYSHCKSSTMVKRDVMFIYKELGLITQHLSATALVQILVKEDTVDGYYNLDMEITFLEFLEILLASSSVFINKQILHQHYLTEQNFGNGIPVFEVVPTHDIPDVDSQPIVVVEDHVTESASSDKPTEEVTSLEPLDTSPSKSSGVTAVQKLSSRSSKRSKKSDKENSSLTLHSKSKERKEHSRTDKKTSSQMKHEESKVKVSSSVTKNNDSTETNLPKKVTTDSLQPESIENTSLTEQKGELSSEDQNVNVRSSQKTLNSVETATSAHGGGVSDETREAVPQESSVVPEPIEDFNTWSLKLNLFFNNYFFPSYEKRRELDEQRVSLPVVSSC